MGSLKERVLNALDDLEDTEFKKFKWLLREPGHVEGVQPLTKSALHGTDTQDVVDLIFNNYPGIEVQLVVILLEKANRKDLKGMFENTPTGAITENPLLAQQIRDLKTEFKKLKTTSNQETAQQVRDLQAEVERLKTASSNQHTAQQVRDLQAEVERLKTASSNQHTGYASGPAVSPVEASGPAVSPVEASGPAVSPVEASGPAVSPVGDSRPAVSPGSTKRDDFLKHSSPLSLDPNTAHRELILSENNMKVTYTEQDQPYADHPERFTYYSPQVLSRESVSDGYFEVEGSGEFVHIAVSYKDIDRAGGSSGFGRNDQSWVLECDGPDDDKSYWFRHNSIDTDLSVPVSSTGRIRLGVYVDHRRGILCFYHVDGNTMRLLHTERTTFTRPLYAGIFVDNATAEVCKIW